MKSRLLPKKPGYRLVFVTSRQEPVNGKKIEHMLFSNITKNWRARPLASLEVIVNLIANTSTQNGLIVKANADMKEYEKGIEVLDEEFEKIKIEKNPVRGDWNYIINP